MKERTQTTNVTVNDSTTAQESSEHKCTCGGKCKCNGGGSGCCCKHHSKEEKEDTSH